MFTKKFNFVLGKSNRVTFATSTLYLDVSYFGSFCAMQVIWLTLALNTETLLPKVSGSTRYCVLFNCSPDLGICFESGGLFDDFLNCLALTSLLDLISSAKEVRFRCI